MSKTNIASVKTLFFQPFLTTLYIISYEKKSEACRSKKLFVELFSLFYVVKIFSLAYNKKVDTISINIALNYEFAFCIDPFVSRIHCREDDIIFIMPLQEVTQYVTV